MEQLQSTQHIKINMEEKFKDIVGDEFDFPKYTTQLINIANQNAKGTTPTMVGQMSELIKQCPDKNFDGWKEWYLNGHPDSIDNATEKINEMIIKMRESMELIDKNMIRKWVEDLVITKTAQGLIIQEIILKYIAYNKEEKWRLSNPQEESKGIDGYIGNIPISIKPLSYLSKKSSVREIIDVEMVYYKKTEKYLYIYTNIMDKNHKVKI